MIFFDIIIYTINENNYGVFKKLEGDIKYYEFLGNEWYLLGI